MDANTHPAADAPHESGAGDGEDDGEKEAVGEPVGDPVPVPVTVGGGAASAVLD